MRPLFKALLILGLVVAGYYCIIYFAPGLAEHPWVQPLLSPLGTVVDSLKQYPAQFGALITGGIGIVVSYMVNRVKTLSSQLQGEANQRVSDISSQANIALSQVTQERDTYIQKYEDYLTKTQTEIGKLQQQVEYNRAELEATQKENDLLNSQVAALNQELTRVTALADEQRIRIEQMTTTNLH